MTVVSTLLGCSSVGAHSKASSASDVSTTEAELTALRVQTEEQEQELRTLRGQLALARAELQDLRSEGERPAELSTRVSGGDELPWAKGRGRRNGELDMQPVLRLDGEVVDEQLPVTADVPDLPAFVEPQPAEAPLPATNIEGYRRGLSLLREQRFEEALAELEVFASDYPSHPYTCLLYTSDAADDTSEV